jgi:AAA+ ATPase superfamily predicted ATPase
MKRYLEAQVRRDLARKMVFVGGPRQVGKTTLARAILGRSAAGYMNWDVGQTVRASWSRSFRRRGCGSSMRFTSTGAGEIS